MLDHEMVGIDEEQSLLDEAWEHVLGSWNEEAAHEKFLALCEVLGRLAVAGQRYRAVAQADPERAESAQKQIDRLVGRAMLSLKAQYDPPDERPRRAVLWIGGLILLALLGFAASYFVA